MSKYAGATWKPTEKHGYPFTDVHDGEGVVIHSAEGSAAGLQSVIDGPREASWHFEVHKDGKIIQRVDTANIAWTNGSFESNKKFWGIENEGVTGEALTSPQFDALAKLVKWLLGPLPHVRGQTLHEHNEMTAYGSLPTSCPNGRIPWNALIEAMKEDEMTDDEILAALKRLQGAGKLHEPVGKVFYALTADPPAGQELPSNHFRRILSTQTGLKDDIKASHGPHGGGTGSGTVTFPGATVSIPAVTVPVEP